MISLFGAVIATFIALGVWVAVAGFRGVTVSERTLPTVDWRGVWLRFGVGFVVFVLVWASTGWPMAGLATGAVAAMVPVLLATRRSRDEQIAKAAALAAWARMLRDTIAAHAGLNQAITTTAAVAPLPIQAEVRNLALRAERMPLGDALAMFAADVDDAVADLIVASLVIADQHQAQDLTTLLSDIAASSQARSAMRRRIETGRARTYASVRWIVALTFGMAVGLILFSPDFLAPYDGFTGQVMFGLVGALFVGAVATLIQLSKPVPEPRLLAGVEDGIAR